jgi:hypothetical protein
MVIDATLVGHSTYGRASCNPQVKEDNLRTTLVRRCAGASLIAAIEILDRGYGRPRQSREVLTPSSQRPQFHGDQRGRGDLLPGISAVGEDALNEREDQAYNQLFGAGERRRPC